MPHAEGEERGVGIATAPEVLVMGRVGVDLYPLQVGVGLADVTSFGKFLGGSAGNVAVAAARHGRRTALISGVGVDPFGRYLRRALGEFGVEDRHVVDIDDLPTPITFCEMFPPDRFPLYFYRRPSAPDLQLTPDHLDREVVSGAGLFWATVTGLCAQPSRDATLAALAMRDRRHPSILDLDWRPAFWDDPDQARPHITAALGRVSVAVGNLEECEMAVGEGDPVRAAEALRALGVRLAVIKMGSDGVFALAETGGVHQPPTPVEVVNGLGAGDAFGGALCHGLLAGWDLPEVLDFANAAGAIVATRLSCSEAMPTTDEVIAFRADRAGRPA